MASEIMEYSDFEEGYAKTRHGELFYMHHPGSLKSILFLHGLGGSTKVWSRLIKYLDPSLDIYLIDLLGHGNSDAPHIEYNIKVQCESILDFVEKINTKEVHIFGHSYGGWIAAYFEYLYHSSSSLILEDIAGIKEYFDDMLSKTEKANYIKDTLEKALVFSSAKDFVIKSILENEFGEEQLDSEKLESIDKPTLILWGEEDKIIDKKYAELIASKIKNSKIAIINGSGHEPHFNNPEEVAKKIKDFYSEIKIK